MQLLCQLGVFLSHHSVRCLHLLEVVLLVFQKAHEVSDAVVPSAMRVSLDFLVIFAEDVELACFAQQCDAFALLLDMELPSVPA